MALNRLTVLEVCRDRLETGDVRGALEEASSFTDMALRSLGAQTHDSKVAKNLADIHQQGQAAIRASHEAHTLSKQKGINPEYVKAAHQNAAQAHQGVMDRLGRAAMRAGSDPKARNWINTAAKIHGLHQSWANRTAAGINRGQEMAAQAQAHQKAAARLATPTGPHPDAGAMARAHMARQGLDMRGKPVAGSPVTAHTSMPPGHQASPPQSAGTAYSGAPGPTAPSAPSAPASAPASGPVASGGGRMAPGYGGAPPRSPVAGAALKRVRKKSAAVGRAEEIETETTENYEQLLGLIEN